MFDLTFDIEEMNYIEEMNDIEEIFHKEDVEGLKNLLNEFVSDINSDISVELETQFVSSVSEKKVYVGLLSLLQGFKSNDELQEIYKEKGFEYHDFYIFALLHEIGHIETTKHLNELELKLSLTAYEFCLSELEQKHKDDREFLEHYIELTLEKLANNWALDFIKNNYSKVVEFTKNFYNQFNKMVDNILREE